VTRLRVIDFETNGIVPPSEVIEVGICDLVLGHAGWDVDEGAHGAYLHACEHLNPEVRAIHHITPAELEGTKPFLPEVLIESALADNVSALVAHNWTFEAQWLGDIGNLHALCTYKAALRVWPDAPSHSCGALRYWLEDQGLISPEPELCQPAHRAGPDAYVTAHILKALLARTTGREMIAWTREPALLPRCPLGDWRGKPWSEVDAGFLRWMVNKPVKPDLVWNAKRELARRMAAV
jgi:exodeoxyribonuclease X